MYASPLLVEPWALNKWIGDFNQRANLQDELAVLDQAFPADWCQNTLEGIPLKHPLATDLLWPGSRARLLALADELLRHRLQARVPMAGSLRHRRQYAPTVSEFLVAPLLAPLGGDLIWQPERRRPGCDYRANHSAGILLGEVKRLSRSQRVEKEEAKRVQEHAQRVAAGLEEAKQTNIFTEEESDENTAEDAERLYPHVRKAAGQLEISAKNAAGKAWKNVPGVLFLEADGNPYITNILPRIERWMKRPWATPIDLVVFFDLRPRNGIWSIMAEAHCARTPRAFALLAKALGQCDKGHFHVVPCSPGTCDLPFGF